MVDINSLTIGEVKEIARLIGTQSPGTSHSLQVGQNYFIRSVTHYYTGKLEAITDTDLLLSGAAWVADTGRFSTALQTGELSEVEPFPDKAIIQRAGIIDISPWNHPLPRSTK